MSEGSSRGFKRKPVALLLAVSIPLGSTSDWMDLSFRQIPKNQVVFAKTSVAIRVASSASPLVHPLPAPLLVTRVRASLAFDGALRPTEVKPATSSKPLRWEEDSVFRLGLVVEGAKTLAGPAKWFAADWVKKLYELAPKGSGIDRIVFLMVSTDAASIGQLRQHPKSELIEERVIAARASDRPALEIDHRLPEPLRVVAIWISVDGDDTQSSFSTDVRSLVLE